MRTPIRLKEAKTLCVSEEAEGRSGVLRHVPPGSGWARLGGVGLRVRQHRAGLHIDIFVHDAGAGTRGKRCSVRREPGEFGGVARIRDHNTGVAAGRALSVQGSVRGAPFTEHTATGIQVMPKNVVELTRRRPDDFAANRVQLHLVHNFRRSLHGRERVYEDPGHDHPRSVRTSTSCNPRRIAGPELSPMTLYPPHVLPDDLHTGHKHVGIMAPQSVLNERAHGESGAVIVRSQRDNVICGMVVRLFGVYGQVNGTRPPLS